MKREFKIVFLITSLFVICSYANDKDVVITKDVTTKSVVASDTKKQDVNSVPQTTDKNVSKWTNWSKIKDLFM